MRMLLWLVVLGGFVGVARMEAQVAPVVKLWTNGAPGALGTADEDVPTITVYLPAKNPTRTGVLIAPGGGYAHLATDKEGTMVAAWLNARGVAAFVLKYRLGPKYRNPVELGDAQRAMRVVRAGAAGYGLDTTKIGMWGFSAGGHLTATAGTMYTAGVSGSSDAVERVSSRPDFLVLCYPVITMVGPYAHTGSREYLLGPHPAKELEEAMSAEKFVTAQTPASFLYSTTDDETVPVENSSLFYKALVEAGVPAEMHLFAHGPHGTGLAQGFPDLKIWPELLAVWMRGRGLME